MLKLFALAAVLLIVGGAIYDMPSKCFSRHFAACSRAEFYSLTSLSHHSSSVLGPINWDDPRI